MHHRVAEAQAQPAAAARARRIAAAVAGVTLAAVLPARADEPEPERPVVATHGWQLAFTGYLQVDLVPYTSDSVDQLDPETGDPLNAERFLIRRARLRAEAKRGPMFGALELDGNTIDRATARLLSAQLGWRFRVATVTAGLFKIPFGVELASSDRYKDFLETPTFARALFPGSYDAGAKASGSYGPARWVVAITNGSPTGDAQWKGVDPSSSHDFVGRLGVVVEGPYRSRFEAGVSGLVGTGLHPGELATEDSPGTPSQTFSRHAIGFDLQVHWCLCAIGRGTLFAEGVTATNLDRAVFYADPVAADRDLRQLGFEVGVVQELGPRVLAGARYDRYQPDRAPPVGADPAFSTLAIMATAAWRGGKLLAEYDHHRRPLPRDDSGVLATRSEDRVTLRAQVGF